MCTAIDVTLAKPNHSNEQLVLMAATVRRSVDKAEQLIDALLAMAVSERDPANVELVDLATVVEDALDDAGDSIQQRRIRVTATLDEAQVFGDPTLMERLASNLVENAVRHNFDGPESISESGTAVAVGLTTGAFVLPILGGVLVVGTAVETSGGGRRIARGRVTG